MQDVPKSLRQRRRRDEEAVSANDNDEHDMEIFVQQYSKVVTANNDAGWGMLTSWCRAALFVLVAMFTASSILQWKFSLGNSSATRKDLKILTVYPRAVVSSLIREVEGQTEVLVTNRNRDAVHAVRASIAMANNLRYHHGNNNGQRKRKRGVVGGLLGLIQSLRSSTSSRGEQRDDGFVPGEILLEAFDEVKMRNYLLEHGARCSSKLNHDGNHHASSDLAENTALLEYDKLVSSIATTSAISSFNEEDSIMLDAIWNQIFQLFAWCQFANGDARGYIAHGTSIKHQRVVSNSKSSLQEMLEISRLAGLGLAAKQQSHKGSEHAEAMMAVVGYEYYDGLHRNNNLSPIFVMPDGSAFKDMAREMLRSNFLDAEPSDRISSMMHSKSLLFNISDEWLERWSLAESSETLEVLQTNEDKKDSHNSDFEATRARPETAAAWVFLGSIFAPREAGALPSLDVRWLARYCDDNDGRYCSYLTPLHDAESDVRHFDRNKS